MNKVSSQEPGIKKPKPIIKLDIEPSPILPPINNDNDNDNADFIDKEEKNLEAFINDIEDIESGDPRP